MTLYAIFDPRPGRPDAPRAVPEKFSFSAALLPPLFFLRHALWLELLGFILAALALFYGALWLGPDAAVLLYALGALWLGLAASSIRRAGLVRAGWRHRADLIAPRADIARLIWLKLDRA